MWLISVGRLGGEVVDLAGGRRSSGEGEEVLVRLTGGGRRVFSNANKVCSIFLSWAGPREVPRSVGHSGAHNIFHFAKGLGHLFMAHGRRAVRIPCFISHRPSHVSLEVAGEGCTVMVARHQGGKRGSATGPGQFSGVPPLGPRAWPQASRVWPQEPNTVQRRVRLQQPPMSGEARVALRG
jgi:hypothetical protein